MLPALGSHALWALTPQSAVKVDRSRCVRHRCRQHGCSKCLDACHAGAIAWDEQGLQVKAAACTQCLRCAAICPTAALQSPEFSLPLVLKDLAAHADPVLGCQLKASAHAHARLPCLGLLGNPELLLLLALVFVDGLQVDLSRCAECPNGSVLRGLHGTFGMVSEIVPVHQVKLVDSRQHLVYQAPALTRRELFGFFRERSTRTAMVMVDRLEVVSQARSYGGKQVPVVRSLLLKAIGSLPEAEQLRIADRMFGQVTFTAACTGCTGCVGVCPSGALKRTDGPGQPPAFDRRLCLNCGSCQAFCRRMGAVQQPAEGVCHHINHDVSSSRSQPCSV